MSPREERIAISAGLEAALVEVGESPGPFVSMSQRLYEIAPHLDNGAMIVDPAANAAYAFADYYVLDSEHGEETMQGIPWEEARQLMRSTIAILAAGSGDLDPRVMAFEWPRGQRQPPPKPPLGARLSAWIRRTLGRR